MLGMSLKSFIEHQKTKKKKLLHAGEPFLKCKEGSKEGTGRGAFETGLIAAGQQLRK